MSERGPKLLPGAEFSHYRIVAELQPGNMGFVYLAEDISLGRRVVVKFLGYLDSDDPEHREQHLKEARLAVTARHPATVTIYEVFTYQNMPAIVMEFIEGQPLSILIEQGPLPWREAADIIRQLCEALADIHGRSLVHGDLKPSNLILEPGGRLRILDFGIARLVGRRYDEWSAATAATLPYTAPEVLTGAASDTRADLFSVGVIFYELLAGRKPFTGTYDAALSYAVVNEPAAPFPALSPPLPAQITAIVNLLLEKNPTRRLQSAGEIIVLLHQVDGPDPAAWRRGIRPSGRWILLAGAALLTVAAAWYAIVEEPAVSVGPTRLAVLPFENLGEPSDEYFADGITDEITSQIARNSGLSVISRNSAQAYKGLDKTLSEIGRELDVSYVLQGSIHWEKGPGDRIRISARLVRTGDDVNVWADFYEIDRARIFDMQHEVALAVGAALNLAVVPGAADTTLSPPTSSLAAYDFYLRGNEYFNRSWYGSDIEFAAGLYHRAVAIDSNFADAWAMLARAEASLFWEYADRTDARCRNAYSAARRSLTLQPNLATGYLALGYCYYQCDRELSSALREWEHGLALDPDNAELHNAVAAVRRRQGELEQAVVGFLRALELDPRSHLKAFDIALTYGMMRRYVESDRFLQRTIDLAPDYSLAHIYRAWLPILNSGDLESARRIVLQASAVTDLTQSQYYWWLQRLLERPGHHRGIELTAATDTIAYLLFRAQDARLTHRNADERLYADSARVSLESKLADQPGDSRYLSALGLAYAGLREPERAIAAGNQAIELLPAAEEAFDAPFLLLNLAEIFVIVGEYDAAVAQLKTVLTIPGFASARYLALDPLWQPLHGHAGFQELLGETVQSES